MTKSGGKGADMGPVSEATLMRFVDGDLPPREHAFVAELIAVHSEATSSVHAYRFTRDELPLAYQQAMNVPPELISRCLPAAERVPRQRRRRPGWQQAALALAASVALVVGGATGWLLRQATQADVAGLLGVAPPGLQRALDTTLAGKAASLAEGLSAVPVSTFSSLDRHWCRLYALSDGQGERARGLACRREDGWHILVQAAARAVPTPGGPNGTAVPAGDDDPVAVYRDQIIGGTPLTRGAEEQLIRDEHWQRTP